MSAKSVQKNSATGAYRTLSERLRERDALFHFNKYGGGHNYGMYELEGLFGIVNTDIRNKLWDTDEWDHRRDYVDDAYALLFEQESDEKKEGVKVCFHRVVLW